MKLVGVDLGGTKILSRLVDVTTGEASGRAKASTPKDGIDAVLAKVVELVEDIDPDREAPAIGIGVPGQIDANGVVARCPNIVGWDAPVDVRAILSEALGRPVVVSNDVNCGALAEFAVGAGKGQRNLLAVFVGTGVGGGVILDGKILSGPRGYAGEIGHVLVTPGGRACGCGLPGHLEAYAGKSGIQREVERLAAVGTSSHLNDLINGGRMKSSHVAAALESGCDVTRQLIQDAADALAQAVGNAATMLDIEAVVFGGGLIDRLGEPFLDQIRGSLSFGGFGREVCELHRAKRIDDAGVVGAALLAQDAVESK
ncbi:MAG: ROK family protein [Acidimicrobiales bacterium]